MLFAYLSDSDGVNVTSVYEMYPIGWFSIKQRFAEYGMDVKIVNVASLMLRYPDIDVRRLHRYLDAVKAAGFKSVSFEQFVLTPDDTLKKMGESTDAYIMLSPESHDPKVSQAAGRGAFAEALLATITETQQLLAEMERALLLDGQSPGDRKDTMRPYNRKILAYSSDQIVPVERPFGGQWFDDFTVPDSIIEAARSGAGEPGQFGTKCA